MYTTQFDNELDSSNLTCQSINISNRELETNITLHEGITSTSQHGSIDGSDRSPLHCIANIKEAVKCCLHISSAHNKARYLRRPCWNVTAISSDSRPLKFKMLNTDIVFDIHVRSPIH